jgi:MYXO-CTERM domain-containing protein
MIVRASALVLALACAACAGDDTGPPAGADGVAVAVDGPAFLRLDPAATTPGGDPVAVARQAARAHAPELGMSARAVDDALLAAITPLPRGGQVVSLRQRLAGVEVWGRNLDVALDRAGRPLALAGRLDPRRPPAAAPAPGGAAAAIAAAYAAWTGDALDPARIGGGEAAGEHTRYPLDLVAGVAADGIAVEPSARARPVWFAASDRLVPAYYVELLGRAELDRTPRGHAFVVSADGAAIHADVDLVDDLAFRYRVWADPATGQPHPSPHGPLALPHATGVPDAARLALTDPVLVEAEGDPAWLAEDATVTIGNNVEARVDRIRDEAGGLLPAPLTGERSFDHVGIDGRDGALLDPDQAFATTTSAFYASNWLHDLFYGHGFDEAAGNAQRDNLGNGGVAGDPLTIRVSWAYNNASMMTPADGASPEMTLYLFNNWGELSATVDGEPRAFVALPSISDDDIGGFRRQAPLVVTATAECAPTSAEMSGAIVLYRKSSWSNDCQLAEITAAAATAGAVGVVVSYEPSSSRDPDTIQTYQGWDAVLPALMVSSRTAAALAAAAAAGPLEVTLDRPLRDSGVDMTIVGHEWAHYMFRRLVAGGSGAVDNDQARALNEGTADFVSLLALARADDLAAPGNDRLQGVYPHGSYALGPPAVDDTTYFGIRRYPYSTDQTRNPLTFRHIENGVELPAGVPVSLGDVNYNNAPHSAGEVWAVSLWECFAALVQAHGFDEGRTRMLGYTVAGLRLVPATPTYVEARDAFLTAAAAADAGDLERMWRAFARRGLGVGARAPARSSTQFENLIESFDHPYQPAVEAIRLVEGAQSCDRDGILDAGELGEVVVRVRRGGPGAQTVTVTGPAEVAFPAGGSAAVPTGADPTAEVRLPIALIALPAGGLALTATVAGGDVHHELTTQLDVHRDRVFASLDDVEAATTVWDRSAALERGWQRVRGPDSMLWRVTLSDGAEHASLVSPPVVDDGTGSLQLAFDHRMYAYGYDGGVVEISTDGGATWVDLGDRATPGYNGWIWYRDYPDTYRRGYTQQSPAYPRPSRVIVDLGDAYHGQTVRFRFRYASRGPGWWDLDNLAITGVQGAPFPRLVANARTCALADAGPDQTVDHDRQVTLSGQGSHAYPGETLSYAWTQVAGPAAILQTPSAASTTFRVPAGIEADTELRFRLTVRSAARGAEASDEVTIHVRSPIVVTVAPLHLLAGTEAAVVATAHGTAGEQLAYEWEQASYGEPRLTLEGTTTPTVRFRVPELEGETRVTLYLRVRSTTRYQHRFESVELLLVPPLALRPTAPVAVGPYAGFRIEDGINRSDVAVTWEQIGGPTAPLEEPTWGRYLAGTAPESAEHAELRYRLTARDPDTDEEVSAEVAIVLAVPDAGADQEVTGGATVTVGRPQPAIAGLTYTWTSSDPSVTLEGADGPTPHFVAPRQVGISVRLAVTVHVGGQAVASDDVTVRVAQAGPPVDAGVPMVPDAGTPAPENPGEDDGGGDGGCGCQSSRGGTGLALGLAGLALVLRRRRRA